MLKRSLKTAWWQTIAEQIVESKGIRFAYQDLLTFWTCKFLRGSYLQSGCLVMDQIQEPKCLTKPPTWTFFAVKFGAENQI